MGLLCPMALVAGTFLASCLGNSRETPAGEKGSGQAGQSM